MARWLVISHGFNMDGRAASQTITDKIPHLISAGIEPIVISAVTGKKDPHLKHYQVLPTGGAGLRFDLRHLLRQHLGQGFIYKISTALISLICLPITILEKIIWGLQSQSSWSITAYLVGLYVIRKHKIDLIYATGGAYSAHVSGLWLKRTTGIPLINEIHDPLVRPGRLPESRDEKFQVKIEHNLSKYSDLCWWFTQGALSAAQNRWPNFKSKGFFILPGSEPPISQTTYQKKSKLVFSHFGSLSESRSLDVFLHSFYELIEKEPNLKNIIEIHIYGAPLDKSSKKVVELFNLQEQVKEYGRLEYCPKLKLSGREQVVRKMQEADCLLLAHGTIADCAEYIPSKVYEYFWASRPILAMTHLNPQLDELIIDRGGYPVPSSDHHKIQKTILDILRRWESDELYLKNSEIRPISVKHCVSEIIQLTKSLR